MRTCTKCGKEQPDENFYTNKRTSNSSRNKMCKSCILENNRKYREAKKKYGEPKPKGYDTYVNDDGVVCITNFNPYNINTQTISKPKTVLEPVKLDRKLNNKFITDL